jgi:hypothetical protein
MHHLAISLFLVAAPSFDDVKKASVPVERLSSTVAAIVGVCPDGLFADELAECQQNVGKAAKAYAGKTVSLYLGGGLEQLLSFGSKEGSQAKLVWAPIIDLGNGLAVTLARPQKVSDAGNVVVARQPFTGKSDEALEASDLERAVKTGQVGVELVGTFGKVWEMKGKGEIVRGVIFDWKAIRFVHTRTGKTLVETTR